MCGRQPYCFGMVRGGFGHFSLTNQSISQIVLSYGKIRPGFHGCREKLNAVGKLPRFYKYCALELCRTEKVIHVPFPSIQLS